MAFAMNWPTYKDKSTRSSPNSSGIAKRNRQMEFGIYKNTMPPKKSPTRDVQQQSLDNEVVRQREIALHQQALICDQLSKITLHQSSEVKNNEKTQKRRKTSYKEKVLGTRPKDASTLMKPSQRNKKCLQRSRNSRIKYQYKMFFTDAVNGYSEITIYQAADGRSVVSDKRVKSTGGKIDLWESLLRKRFLAQFNR